MLKNLKRVLISLLVICMILGCVSCNNNGNDEGETESDTQIETESETTPRVDKVDIKLDDKHASITVTSKKDTLLNDSIKAFARTYADTVGAISVTPRKRVEYVADKSEIIIGDVGYPESDEVYSTLKYNEVKVRVVGSKLVVAGYDSETISEVLTELAKMLEENKDSSGNISLGADFVIDRMFAAPLSVLPVLDGLSPTYVDTGDDCHMLNFGSTKEDKFNSYCNAIADEGFTLYSEKEIDGNTYRAYVNDEYVVTAIYTSHNNMCKVLSEPLSATALPTKAEDNVYTPVNGCDTTITQVGLYDGSARTYNGMCYIIRLVDGSFIVVDGGFDCEGYADRIYNILKKQAPNPDKIVIAAWIITHAHDDHVDVFEDFFDAYAEKLTIEKFICNLPDSGQLVDNWANERDGNIRYTENMREFLNTTFPNVPQIKAHPGQEFYIRNAKINILFTLDVYDSKFDDYNNSSVVFKLEAEGKSMLFLGDHDDKGKTMMSLYKPSTLDSDIVQVAHHGLPENSCGAVYARITPKHVFWPASAWIVKGNIDLYNGDQNKWIIENCDANNIYLAEDNLYVFTMKDCTCVKYETVAEYLNG